MKRILGILGIFAAVAFVILAAGDAHAATAAHHSSHGLRMLFDGGGGLTLLGLSLGGGEGQSWPLTTGNNDNPALTQGSPTSFFCNTVPDRAPGGLANYLPYVALTLTGNLVQSGATGVAIPWDRLVGFLIDSIDWINAWHGTPVSANHVKGFQLPIIEYVAGGYRYASRRRDNYPAANGTYPFEYTVAVPASSRLARLINDTAQLALCYQNSQIKLNVASNAALLAFSPGSSITSFAARASARLIPRADLVLGTPVEWILHQVVAGANSPQVQIQGFGTSTMLTGVESKGGVLWLAELTNVNGMGGAFLANNATQFSFPWRSQVQTSHILSLTQDMLACLPNDRPQNANVNQGNAQTSEFHNYPFIQGNTPTLAANLDLTNLMYFPLGPNASNETRLTDLQTADSDQSYFLTVNGGFTGATHLIQAQYAKQWQGDKINDWVRLVTNGGASSLAAHVLGASKMGGAKISQRVPKDLHVLTADQKAYLAYQMYVPA